MLWSQRNQNSRDDDDRKERRLTGIKKPKRRFKKKKRSKRIHSRRGLGFGPVATADTIWYRMVFIYIMMEFNLPSINECLCINNQKHVVQGVYYPVDLSHTAGPFMIIVHHGYIWSAWSACCQNRPDLWVSFSHWRPHPTTVVISKYLLLQLLSLLILLVEAPGSKYLPPVVSE